MQFDCTNRKQVQNKNNVPANYRMTSFWEWRYEVNCFK